MTPKNEMVIVNTLLKELGKTNASPEMIEKMKKIVKQKIKELYDLHSETLLKYAKKDENECLRNFNAFVVKSLLEKLKTNKPVQTLQPMGSLESRYAEYNGRYNNCVAINACGEPQMHTTWDATNFMEPDEDEHDHEDQKKYLERMVAERSKDYANNRRAVTKGPLENNDNDNNTKKFAAFDNNDNKFGNISQYDPNEFKSNFPETKPFPKQQQQQQYQQREEPRNNGLTGVEKLKQMNKQQSYHQNTNTNNSGYGNNSYSNIVKQVQNKKTSEYKTIFNINPSEMIKLSSSEIDINVNKKKEQQESDKEKKKNPEPEIRKKIMYSSDSDDVKPVEKPIKQKKSNITQSKNKKTIITLNPEIYNTKKEHYNDYIVKFEHPKVNLDEINILDIKLLNAKMPIIYKNNAINKTNNNLILTCENKRYVTELDTEDDYSEFTIEDLVYGLNTDLENNRSTIKIKIKENGHIIIKNDNKINFEIHNNDSDNSVVKLFGFTKSDYKNSYKYESEESHSFMARQYYMYLSNVNNKKPFAVINENGKCEQIYSKCNTNACFIIVQFSYVDYSQNNDDDELDPENDPENLCTFNGLSHNVDVEISYS